MTSLERVMTAINLKEPDVVPHFDSVTKVVRDAILPGASYVLTILVLAQKNREHHLPCDIVLKHCQNQMTLNTSPPY